MVNEKSSTRLVVSIATWKHRPRKIAGMRSRRVCSANARKSSVAIAPFARNARDVFLLEERHDALGDAAVDRALSVAHHAIEEDLSRAPILVDELRAARREVDDAHLHHREALRPQRPAARCPFLESERARAIARREREKEHVASERPAVVMEMEAVAEHAYVIASALKKSAGRAKCPSKTSTPATA